MARAPDDRRAAGERRRKETMERAVGRVYADADVGGVRLDVRGTAAVLEASVRPSRGGRDAELQQRQEE